MCILCDMAIGMNYCMMASVSLVRLLLGLSTVSQCDLGGTKVYKSDTLLGIVMY